MNNTDKENASVDEWVNFTTSKIGHQIAAAEAKMSATSLSATATIINAITNVIATSPHHLIHQLSQQQQLPMQVRIIEPRPQLINLNSTKIFIRPTQEKTIQSQQQNQQVSKNFIIAELKEFILSDFILQITHLFYTY